MTPKQRRAILIGIGVAFLLLLLWLLMMLLPKRAPEVKEAPVTQTEAPATPAQTPFSDQQLQAEKQTRTQASGVIVVAKMFVERYGSYSNEANFQNVRDVLPLMSAGFAASTTADLATKTAPTGYYGITTKVITVQSISQNDAEGTASVRVSTQQVEEIGSAQNTAVRYRDMDLTFVKESGVWVVDSATWR